MSEVVIISKLAGSAMDIDAAQGKKGLTFLYRVYGKASGIKETKSQKDDAVLYGVTGEFRAVPAHNPEITFQSGVAYFPPGVNDMIVNAVDTGEIDEKGRRIYREIKFAFDVYSKPSSSIAGYQYEVRPVVDARETDVMQELTEQLPPMPGSPKPAAIEETKAEKKTK